MFKALAASLLNASAGPTGTLRTDLYSAIDRTKTLLASENAGDGIAFQAILSLVARHVPVPFSSASNATAAEGEQKGGSAFNQRGQPPPPFYGTAPPPPYGHRHSDTSGSMPPKAQRGGSSSWQFDIGSGWQPDGKEPIKSVAVTGNKDHFPFMHVAIASEEIPVVVGGVTNMVFALSRVDGVAGSMAARTWVDALGEVYRAKSEALKNAGEDEEAIEKLETFAQGIVKGVGQFADVTLLTREFGPRVQIMSLIKSVSTMVFGVGSEKARNAEAFLSMRFMH